MNTELEKLKRLTRTITNNGYLIDQTTSWRYAFDSVNELVCITNTEFEIKYMNKPLMDKLCADFGQYINTPLASLFEEEHFPNKPALVEQTTNNVIDCGESFIKELNGWYSKQKCLIKNASGKLIGYTFMLSDITTRRKTEQELVATNKLLEGVLNAIPDIIGVQDNEGNLLNYNRSGLDLFNVTSKQLESRKCYELLGRTTPCTNCQTKACKVLKKPAKQEKYIKELNAWFDCRSYPILDDEGNVSKVIEHLRDITELKEEQNKKESYYRKMTNAFKRLHFIVTAVDGYIWEREYAGTNKAMVHTYVDPAFCQDFYGLDVTKPVAPGDAYAYCKEAYGKTCSELIERFVATGRKHTFGKICTISDSHCIDQGKPCEYFEMGYIERIKGNPEWFILRVRKTPIFNDEGECTGILGFANDCSSDAHSVQLLVQEGLLNGDIKKLDNIAEDAKVFWIVDRHHGERNLSHLDF